MTTQKEMFSRTMVKAYEKWRQQMLREGRPTDRKEFARWLGGSPWQISNWLNGDSIPNDASLHQINTRLAELGMSEEIYRAAGRSPVMPDDPQFRKFFHIYAQLDKEGREKVLEQMEQLAEEKHQAEQAKFSLT